MDKGNNSIIMSFVQNNNNRTFVGDRLQPSLEDRKRAIYSSKEFISSIDCVIESSSRNYGTYGSYTTNLLYGVKGCFAASLASVSIPMNFGTNLYSRSFDVTYANVTAYPGSFTLVPGYYYYSVNAGTVTYTEASAYPSSNNLLYYILNYFSGAITSLTVLPQSGGITWNWNSAATGNVSSTNVPAWFNLLSTNGISWLSNGNPLDLSGVKTIGLIIPDISCQNSKSNVTGIPNYFCTIPVSVGYGSVLAYEPIREEISWFGNAKTISSLTVRLVDTATNTVLPMVSDWSMVIRFYTNQEQAS